MLFFASLSLTRKFLRRIDRQVCLLVYAVRFINLSILFLAVIWLPQYAIYVRGMKT